MNNKLIVFRLLPKKMLSHAMGKLVSLPLPKWILKLAIKLFSRYFKVDWQIVAEPIAYFNTFQDFFIRKLKAGVRPIDSEANAIVSPCDGSFGQTGTINNGVLLQIKGRSYSLTSFLASESLAGEFEGGTYVTIYLSPRDYHRFHAPFNLQLMQNIYLPGKFWPVNQWAVANVENLFSVNERKIMLLKSNNSLQVSAAMVAVGAMMVGKIKTNFIAPSEAISKGEEMGYFEFGSTIVLLIKPKFGNLNQFAVGMPIKMGQTIGKLI